MDVFSSKNFLDSWGVNTHLSDVSSPYGNLEQVKQELDYIDVKSIRDTNAFSWSVGQYQALANSGIKLDLVISHNPGYELGGSGTDNDITIIEQIVNKVPNSILALEGQNEPWYFIDTFNSQPINNWNLVEQVQSYTSSKLSATTDLSSIPFLAPSVSSTSFSGAAPDFTGIAQIANLHAYPYGGLQPREFIGDGVTDQHKLLSNSPVWLTEFGYSNTPQDSSYGVDSGVQAKNTLDGLLDAFQLGVSKTFLYELTDETANIPSNQAWGALGLFNYDGSAKPVAVALHNLSSILSNTPQPDGNFDIRPLNISVNDPSGSTHSLLLEKSFNVYDLVVWNESNDWDPSLQKEINSSSIPVEITLPVAAKQASVYDPLLGTTAIYASTNTKTIDVGVIDHPVVIELSFANQPSIKVSDSLNNSFDVHPIDTGKQTFLAADTGLEQSFTQSIGNNGVDTISTPLWNAVRTVSIVDSGGGSWATNAFLETNIQLSGAQNGSLLLTNAKRGVIDLSHDGNYHVTINAHSNAADPVVGGVQQHLNDFVVTLGSGENIVTLRGDADRTHGVFTTGSGHAVIFGAGAGNDVTFGSGRAEITGGTGADHYVYHANSGVDIIQNFDSLHDTITLDASLKATMHVSTGVEGTTLIFGSTAHELVLHAISNFDPNHIIFT